MSTDDDGSPSKHGGCNCKDKPFEAQQAIRALSQDVAALTDLVLALVREGEATRRPHELISHRNHPDQKRVEPLAELERIVGGESTRAYESVVCLGDDQQFYCSGTLIHRQAVLTAAHCGGEITRVLVGWRTEDPASHIVRVRRVQPHPYYDAGSHRNDLSLLLLDEPAASAPTPLATPEELAKATLVTLVGFGYNDPNRPMGFGTKRKVTVPILALGKSADAARLGYNEALEFVAGRKFLGRDSCNGDSGGPAFIDTAAGVRLAGVTSRATREAQANCGDGGVYVRPAEYLEWVRETLVQFGVHT